MDVSGLILDSMLFFEQEDSTGRSVVIQTEE